MITLRNIFLLIFKVKLQWLWVFVILWI